MENKKPRTCEELLKQYSKIICQCSKGEKLVFENVDGKDVYNITQPFINEKELIIAGRVEARDSEDSEIFFFVEQKGKWSPKEKTRVFRLQDPFITFVDGELVFGGVEIFPHPLHENALWYRTVFYRGENIYSLEKFATGPDGMKDIRLIELEDKSIAVFTRPQGEVGGRGQIGFIKIKSLDDLDIKTIEKAKIIKGQFVGDEWGGANELHLLKNGLVGILGHISKFDADGNRRYYPMTFAFDVLTQKATKLKIFATRDSFPNGAAKRPDLEDVVFSGGVNRCIDEKAILYAGISDAEAHKICIPDPFIEYESMK
ncbi:MAG: hypothetical protein COA82_10220 [Alkaliphilus sp.]|nr:DUF1861 family protein [Alkaliphilus sp. AH-315-G20]PHS31350.1 MAG: hypothetical protein COA82_10220 [Alkaliphilus sp.]